jgi:hypothetical protein
MTFEQVLSLNTWLGRSGYMRTYLPDHPKASAKGDVEIHVLMAEIKHGGSLPDGAVVHHIDCDRTNNHPDNIHICYGGHAEHKELHRRINARSACGHEDWYKCYRCRMYSPLGDGHNGTVRAYRASTRGGDCNMVVHRECDNQYRRELKERKRNAA